MTRKTTAITTSILILAIFALVGGAIITTGVLLQTPAAVYAQLSDVDDIIDDSLEIADVDAELNQDQSQILGQDSLGDFGEDNADLDAVNVAIPIAVPINVDEEEEEEEVPTDEEPPDDEDGVFCFVAETDVEETLCFETSAACEIGENVAEGLGTLVEECQEFETPPPGALDCVIVAGALVQCELTSL